MASEIPVLIGGITQNTIGGLGGILDTLGGIGSGTLNTLGSLGTLAGSIDYNKMAEQISNNRKRQQQQSQNGQNFAGNTFVNNPQPLINMPTPQLPIFNNNLGFQQMPMSNPKLGAYLSALT